MASGNIKDTRLRRLRARYRRQMIVTAIVALLVGLVLGFAICVVSLNQVGFVSRLFRLGPTTPTEIHAIGEDIGATPTPESTPTALPATLPITEEPEAEETAQPPVYTSTPEVTEPAVTIGSTSMIVAWTAEATMEATPEPTQAPTEVPTEVPTQVPTEGPTEVPTEVPTEMPTEVPTEVPTVVPAEVPTEVPAVMPAEVPTEVPTQVPTEVPTMEAIPEPTAVPTPVPTPAPIIVPYGQPYSVQTEINAEGNAREVANDAPYELLNVTVKVNEQRDPTYYQEQYSTKYRLKGDEAVVEFDVTVNDYTGTTTLIPQNFMNVSLMGKTPDIVNNGYQLMSAEIGGETNVAVTPDVATTLYKRYSYSADQGKMSYMVLTTWRDGEPQEVWFDLVAPEPEPTFTPEPTAEPESLTIGSKGEEVKKLQSALIEKGLLSGSPDGKFGKFTAEAVSAMQKRLGMEETGIADAEFLAKLYAEE